MESPACSSIKLSSLCLAVGMALANPVLAQESDSHFEEVVVWGVFLQLQVVICLTLGQFNGKNGSAHEVQHTWQSLRATT